MEWDSDSVWDTSSETDNDSVALSSLVGVNSDRDSDSECDFVSETSSDTDSLTLLVMEPLLELVTSMETLSVALHVVDTESEDDRDCVKESSSEEDFDTDRSSENVRDTDEEIDMVVDREKLRDTESVRLMSSLTDSLILIV